MFALHVAQRASDSCRVRHLEIETGGGCACACAFFFFLPCLFFFPPYLAPFEHRSSQTEMTQPTDNFAAGLPQKKTTRKLICVQKKKNENSLKNCKRAKKQLRRIKPDVHVMHGGGWRRSPSKKIKQPPPAPTCSVGIIASCAIYKFVCADPTDRIESGNKEKQCAAKLAAPLNAKIGRGN